jgi:hypothetical protein
MMNKTNTGPLVYQSGNEAALAAGRNCNREEMKDSGIEKIHQT